MEGRHSDSEGGRLLGQARVPSSGTPSRPINQGPARLDTAQPLDYLLSKETFMNATRPSILVVNGPNLNLLGKREPRIYGYDTLADAEALARTAADSKGYDLDFFQSNWEGAIIDRLHEARGVATGVIINPAGFTSVSIAILDTLLAVELPVVEVHISNIHKREEFRHFSFTSTMAEAVIAGCGISGYKYAVDFLIKHLESAK
jgi:3-dehydroquinate dehydratase-2